MIRRDDLREGDIGALGKERIVFEHGADRREIIGSQIIDEKYRMGVAHVDRAGNERRTLGERERNDAGVCSFTTTNA